MSARMLQHKRIIQTIASKKQENGSYRTESEAMGHARASTPRPPPRACARSSRDAAVRAASARGSRQLAHGPSTPNSNNWCYSTADKSFVGVGVELAGRFRCVLRLGQISSSQMLM